jgi:hypothetical protein
MLGCLFFDVAICHMLLAIGYFCGAKIGGVAEMAEGSRLLSGCGGKTSPRVRIPAPP